MAKFASRYQRHVNDRETRMLRLWQAAVSPVDAFYAQMAEGLFRAVKWAVAQKLDRLLMDDGRFSHCDTRINDYYKKLMFYYANALRLLNQAAEYAKAGGMDKITGIVGGMSAVVMSRLKAYEDNNRAGSREGDSRELEAAPNQAMSEKQMLVSRHILVFSDNFGMVSYRPRSELYAEMFHATRMRFINYEGVDFAKELYGQAIRIICEKGFPNFYELYKQSLQSAGLELCGFYHRNAAAYYGAELLGEHEILRNLATVQVPALARVNDRIPYTDNVKRAADEAINGVMAAYQSLSRDVAEISEALQQAGLATAEPEEYEAFAGSLLDAVAEETYADNAVSDAVSGFETRFEAMRQAFGKELSDAVIGWQDLDKNAKDPAEAASEMIDAEIALAAGIRDIFEGIHRYFDEDERLKTDDSADGRISQGIAETVFIKVESLNEAAAGLRADMEALREKLSTEERKEFPWLDELAASAFEGMIGEVARFQKEDRRALSAIMKYMNFRTDNEFYAPYAARVPRPGVKTLEQIEMKLLKFKKEQTLYEVSTFEEIQLYSVTRLRESGAGHIKDFVRLLDEAAGRISEILAGYGIQAIRPDTRDMFNGREHEVLMAEQNESFKKGEIIKLLNSGYRQGEVILLRANVIAAR
ncbi:MAG: nucleotide exchange factor GrpE [Defluviitaleaceae bacterium]|nr:nucleotide exchange factor GrpE [Defluviitaleaceae bacterium]MCL2836298.1 nucleotide exchange factor GrpE [Defluviitaleaceae bacterium]